MFKKIIEAREVIKVILSKRSYFALFLSASIFIFVIFYLLTLATTTGHSIKIFVMMNGFWYAIATFFLLAVSALLFGLYLCLLLYKIWIRDKKNKISGFFGASGLITGLFSAGCPMCGSVLFALFGAPLALFFLPFKGIELRLLAIMLLSISVWILSRSLIECNLDSNPRRKKRYWPKAPSKRS